MNENETLQQSLEMKVRIQTLHQYRNEKLLKSSSSRHLLDMVRLISHVSFHVQFVMNVKKSDIKYKAMTVF